MILFPAIDIKDGKCIRLTKGLLNNIKIYNQDPIEQAKIFKDSGCEWIHIVDIDAAFSGKPSNYKIIYEIKEVTGCKIQVGGGIRNIETIKALLFNSIDRVILGTVAVENPKLIQKVCKEFPNQIIVGVDSKNRRVATEGWSKTTSILDIEFIKNLDKIGVKRVIYTDIEKDGLLDGMSLKQIKELLFNTSIKIIASGGVSSLDDLTKLKELNDKNLEGVIVGKAIYEQKIKVSEAIKILK